MAIIQSGADTTKLLTVDPTFTAARMAPRPVEQLNTFYVGAPNGGTVPAALSGVGANLPIFSMRFVAGSAGQAQICIINKITIGVIMTTGFTTAQRMILGGYVARSFSGSDSGGSQIIVSGSNQKARTSGSTSQIATGGDMRIASTGAITVGTRTLDSLPFGAVDFWCTTTMPPNGIAGLTTYTLYDNAPGNTPIVIANNEGIVINNILAMGAGGVLGVVVNINWTESASTATLSY